ncbi:MAG: vitamin B12 dependent-methionine synthase activation domain-containing protein [Spirochaetales bacterium]|uniref:Vitamin B12 dependent-methionine synthase activation domain-containing protein n=1 Tax=Candidatus Thalassospirochaeta sargassi TaxID=3119039 RepID=A0AAJ1MIF0_9SPIO|nr:vitamin B12 dependent-methionine synthase activation domain-containing protein [Spirochaetales bacterium]
MFPIRGFNYIPVRVPRHKILKRLGYNSRSIEISGEMLAEVDGLIAQAADLIELRGVCLRTALSLKESDAEAPAVVEVVDTDVRFLSDKLYDFLSGSGEILIMGITGGSRVTDEIKELQLEKKMTSAVVIDAAASEIVDDGFDWIASLYSKELVREGRVLSTRRFSAGYGDFDIRFQNDIHSLLDMERLGVSITESSMLLPEKSVTAIYGITNGDNNE